MGTPPNSDDYTILKMEPDPRGCCCTHCWPQTWVAVNRHISPAGPIGHEGSVLVGDDGGRFVLEGHESGPEIIVFASASVGLVTAIIALITTILKNVTQDRKAPSRIRLVKRFSVKGKFEEEVVMELELPLSADTVKQLEAKVLKTLKKHRTKPSSVRAVARR